MNATACTCDHAIPAHFLWNGCSDEDCGCEYRYLPTSSPAARKAALEAAERAVREAKLKGGRL